jgi:hypothetical protein
LAAGDTFLRLPAPFDLPKELLVEEGVFKEILNHLIEALAVAFDGFEETSGPLGDCNGGRAT